MILNKDYRKCLEAGLGYGLPPLAKRNKYHSLLIASGCFAGIVVLIIGAVLMGGVQ